MCRIQQCVRLSLEAVWPLLSFFGSGVAAVHPGWKDSGVMSKLFRIKGFHSHRHFALFS